MLTEILGQEAAHLPCLVCSCLWALRVCLWHPDPTGLGMLWSSLSKGGQCTLPCWDYCGRTNLSENLSLLEDSQHTTPVPQGCMCCA